MKAYDEVNFNDQYILRWIREGDEYVNRITFDMMDDLQAVVKGQRDRIAELEKAFSDLYNEYKEYYKQTKQTDKDLAAYQQQAAELWNDSCTSNRSTK